MQIERRQLGLVECKLANDSAGTFSGYGAVFGNVDSYGDVIEPGAFKDTLSAWRAKGKLPKMLLQHGGVGLTSEDMLPIGQWTEMSEDAKGLKVSGRLFAMNTDLSQRVYEGLKSGELDSLSIGYQTEASRDTVKDGITTRHLTEIKLWEVSIVTFPANDKALISGVKAFTPQQLRSLEATLRDGGLSQANAVTAISGFKAWLQRDAEAPIIETRDEISPDEADLLKMLTNHEEAIWAEVFRG
jgi:hypothetical protein